MLHISFQYKLLPFCDQRLNHAQLLSSFITVFIMYTGLYFLRSKRLILLLNQFLIDSHYKVMAIIFLVFDVIIGLSFLFYIIIAILRLRKLKESDVREQIKQQLKKRGVRRKRVILNSDPPEDVMRVKPKKKKSGQNEKIEKAKKSKRPKTLTHYPVQLPDDEFSKEISTPTRLQKLVLNTVGNDNSPGLPETPKSSHRSNIIITLESPDDKSAKRIFPFSQFSRDKFNSRNFSRKDLLLKESDSFDTSNGLLTVYSPVTDGDQLMKFSTFRTIQDTVVLTKCEKDNNDEKNESCEITIPEQNQEPEAQLPNLSFVEMTSPRNKSEEFDLEKNKKTESSDIEEFD